MITQYYAHLKHTWLWCWATIDQSRQIITTLSFYFSTLPPYSPSSLSFVCLFVSTAIPNTSLTNLCNSKEITGGLVSITIPVQSPCIFFSRIMFWKHMSGSFLSQLNHQNCPNAHHIKLVFQPNNSRVAIICPFFGQGDEWVYGLIHVSSALYTLSYTLCPLSLFKKRMPACRASWLSQVPLSTLYWNFFLPILLHKHCLFSYIPAPYAQVLWFKSCIFNVLTGPSPWKTFLWTPEGRPHMCWWQWSDF